MTSNGAVRLYDYWRSSSAYRVRIALNLLGLDYETVAIDLTKGEQESLDHLEINPQGLVPVLMIDGRKLTQSLAIIEYLDETRAAGFLPTEPASRADVRSLAMAVAMEVQPVCNLRVARAVVGRSDGAIGMEEWMQMFIAPGLTALETMLRRAPQGAYAYGDQVTLADICLVPQVYNAERWGIDLAAFPRISEVVLRLRALGSIAAAHPDRALERAKR